MSAPAVSVQLGNMFDARTYRWAVAYPELPGDADGEFVSFDVCDSYTEAVRLVDGEHPEVGAVLMRWDGAGWVVAS